MFVHVNTKGEFLTIKDCLVSNVESQKILKNSGINFEEASSWIDIYQGIEYLTPSKIKVLQSIEVTGAEFCFSCNYHKPIKLTAYTLFLLWEMSPKFKFVDEMLDSEVFIFSLTINSKGMIAIGYIKGEGFGVFNLKEYFGEDDEDLIDSICRINLFAHRAIEKDDDVLIDTPDIKQLFLVEGAKILSNTNLSKDKFKKEVINTFYD